MTFRVTVHGTPAPQGLPRHLASAITVDSRGCWLWQQSRSPDGYGWASLDNRTHQAHRLVYELLVGRPGAGLVLDHLCRVRHCVNPDHLEEVAPAENLRRGDTPAGWERCQRCGEPFGVVGRQRRCIPCRDAYEVGRLESKRMAERARRQRLREVRP